MNNRGTSSLVPLCRRSAHFVCQFLLLLLLPNVVCYSAQASTFLAEPSFMSTPTQAFEAAKAEYGDA